MIALLRKYNKKNLREPVKPERKPCNLDTLINAEIERAVRSSACGGWEPGPWKSTGPERKAHRHMI